MINEIEDLKAWQKARAFRRSISKVSRRFPSEEKTMLSRQIIRSSRSVSANLSEGFGRYHFQEYTQFCRIARGSLVETIDHLYVALDEEYIDQETFDLHRKEATELKKIINGVIKHLQTSKQTI